MLESLILVPPTALAGDTHLDAPLPGSYAGSPLRWRTLCEGLELRARWRAFCAERAAGLNGPSQGPTAGGARR